MRTSLTALARLLAGGLAATALGCSSGPAPRSSEPGAPPETAYETFDIVWELVDTKHFDPTHNGVDWEAIGATYRPQIEATRSNADVRRLLQRMLGELGQSHFVIIPALTFRAPTVFSSTICIWLALVSAGPLRTGPGVTLADTLGSPGRTPLPGGRGWPPPQNDPHTKIYKWPDTNIIPI